MVYSIQTRRLKTLADIEELPDGEVADFLREWFSPEGWVMGHTSGSTGHPKAIRLSKADMRASAHLTNAFLGITEDNVLLLSLSVTYIAGKMMVVRALEAGAELLVGEVSSRPLKEWEGDRPIDLAAMVPMQVENSLLYPEDAEKFKFIRQLLIGGASVSAFLERQLASISTCCYATYGMTETVSHIALRRLNTSEAYTALGKVSFSVDDRGCLVIHTPHLQQKQFVTNDLVEFIDHRHFHWLGRYDHVINSGGLKFLPEAIEAKLQNSISGRYFITSMPDERLGQRIVLVLEGEQWNEKQEMALLTSLRKLLSAYELPRQIFYLDHFQETSSGKVLRKLPFPDEKKCEF